MSEFVFPPAGTAERVSDDVSTANIARFAGLVSQNLARPETRFTGLKYLLELESPGYEIAVSRVHEAYDLSKSGIGIIREIAEQQSKEAWAGKKSHITMGRITVANLTTGYNHAYGYDEDFDSLVRNDSPIMTEADRELQRASADEHALNKELEAMTGDVESVRRELAETKETAQTMHTNKMFTRDLGLGYWDVKPSELDDLEHLIANAHVKPR